MWQKRRPKPRHLLNRLLLRVSRLVHLNQLLHLSRLLNLSRLLHLNQILHLNQLLHPSRRLHLNRLLLIRPGPGLLALIIVGGGIALSTIARLWKPPVSFTPESRLDAVADGIVTTAGHLEARSFRNNIR